MPLYDEVWDDSQFASRDRVDLISLPQNHVAKLTLLQFDFVEYKANQNVACFVYEKMMLHCVNQYGLQEDLQRRECLDAIHWFDTCVKLNNALGQMKKVNPESFLENPYSRTAPRPSDLGF